MILFRLLVVTGWSGAPRVSGDDPALAQKVLGRSQCSPRERG